MSELYLQPHDTILFIGDSITDCGRRTEHFEPYGRGYVAHIRNLLLARYPAHDYTVLNHGIGGNTIRDLDARWQADAVDPQPDVLSIKIGINDVWRFVTNRLEQAVPKDEYADTYRLLLQQVREQTQARLVLMEPYVLETDHDDHFRRLIDDYLPVVHQLAEEFDARLVRTQEALDAAMAEQPSSFWAHDRVHPDGPGHMVIARAWLDTIGFAWS